MPLRLFAPISVGGGSCGLGPRLPSQRSVVGNIIQIRRDAPGMVQRQMVLDAMNHAAHTSRKVGILLEQQRATPVGFEPTRGDPIGLAGRRLNRSAKVSLHCWSYGSRESISGLNDFVTFFAGEEESKPCMS